MLSFLWDLEELKQINQDGRKLRTEAAVVLDIVRMPSRLHHQHNLARKLGLIRSKLCAFIKCLYRLQRTPATHMFVFMISSALRNKKPYAFPIQCIVYAGLKEKYIRQLVNAISKEMVTAGMKVAGINYWLVSKFCC